MFSMALVPWRGNACSHTAKVAQEQIPKCDTEHYVLTWT